MVENLVLAGCGHIGRAMLEPWLEKKAARKIWVVEPNRDSLHPLEEKGASVCATPSLLPVHLQPDVVVFAVQPQILGEVMKEYKKYSGSLFLSIAAGKKVSAYTSALGNDVRIIRAMPNLAAKVHEAAILLVAGGKASSPDRTVAEVLFSVLGKTFWLEDESLMDTGTALSGCGPGYFYLLADEMAKAGQKLGLSPQLAADLARQTLIGSAQALREETAPLEALYKNVAVRGGMTEAAIKVLQDKNSLKNLMEKALKAAETQGRKLSS